MRAEPLFPLSAVVGTGDLRLALLLNAVSPEVGGVLVRGEKGTAKSTAVRALAALLPALEAVPGCRFGCDPARPDPGCPDGPHPPGAGSQRRAGRLVELPVGASEDRLLGALDLERALAEGVRAFEPGLLAAAHRGVLYVDEVNLLNDHLVDVLLDAAAAGRVHVEREGVSVSHAARFLLVGTMNPEEGELRPQLLDRFGLTVEVRASRDAAERTEVVRRRLAFDADPEGFVARWDEAESALAERIAAARDRLPKVTLEDGELHRIAGVCAAFDVDGMRADLVIARTARAHAAWSGRDTVTEEDVRVAARFALPHRRRRDPFDAPGLDEEQLDEAIEQSAPPPPASDAGPDQGPESSDGPEPDDGPDGPDDPDDGGGGPGGGGVPHGTGDRPPAATGAGYRVRTLRVDGLGEGRPGRRSRSLGPDGYTVGVRPQGSRGRGLHLPATLAAAAPHQLARGRSGGRVLLRPGDVRLPLREDRESNLVLFCVDASGSMAAARRMSEVKGAIAALLRDAYQRRDTVGLVTFRGAEADLALPPTGAVEVARARLERLPTGGRTPIAAGLITAHRTLLSARRRDPRRRPLLVLVTDGRHTSGPDPSRVAAALARDGVRSVVVDCETGPVRLGLAVKLAAALGAEHLPLEQVRAEALAGVVRSRLAPADGRAA